MAFDLFKTFQRGQENAQDQLNENFEKIEGLEIDVNDDGDTTIKGQKVMLFSDELEVIEIEDGN